MSSRPPAVPRPAPASRLRAGPWRSPRVIVGVVLVLASAVGGAALFGLADDSASYWAVRTDVRAGQRIERGDLVAVDARLGRSAAGTVLAAERPLAGSYWSQSLAAGSLVTRASVRSTPSAGQQLPVLVTAGAMPDDLAVGERVDVWVGPGADDDATQSSTRVLTAARVHSLGESGSAGSRTVVLAVGTLSADGSVISQVASSHVTLVRVG